MSLPITAMLEERLLELDGIGMSDAIAESEAIERFIPQVRTLEVAHNSHYKDMEQSYQEKLYGTLQNEIRILDYIEKAKEKAKEEGRAEERSRVMGILEEMVNNVSPNRASHYLQSECDGYKMEVLQEAITRITN